MVIVRHTQTKTIKKTMKAPCMADKTPLKI